MKKNQNSTPHTKTCLILLYYKCQVGALLSKLMPEQVQTFWSVYLPTKKVRAVHRAKKSTLVIDCLFLFFLLISETPNCHPQLRFLTLHWRLYLTNFRFGSFLSFSRSRIKTLRVWGFRPSSRSNLANLPKSQSAFFLHSSFVLIHLNRSSKPIDKGFPDNFTTESSFPKLKLINFWAISGDKMSEICDEFVACKSVMVVIPFLANKSLVDEPRPVNHKNKVVCY